MSTFKQTIEVKISESLKAGQPETLSVLRDIKAQIVNTEKNNKNQELDSVQTLAVLDKMAKSRRQSIEEFTKGNRKDLADKETFELSIIETYLPKKLNAEEVKIIVAKIIAENSYTTKRDMGSVIKKFNEQYAGQSDGKTITDLCKEVLV